jgi:hypothetical protein
MRSLQSGENEPHVALITNNRTCVGKSHIEAICDFPQRHLLKFRARRQHPHPRQRIGKLRRGSGTLATLKTGPIVFNNTSGKMPRQ